MARIDWRGSQVLARVAEATKLAIDKTMSECVSGAKRDHPWVSDTGFEEGAIRMGAATLRGLRVTGAWGAYTNYSLFLEIGTSRIGPTATTREQEGGGLMWNIPDVQPGAGIPVLQSFTILPPGTMDGQDGFVTVHRPSIGVGNPGLLAPRPFLRPQADRHYPLLGARIGAAYRGESMP